jgi:eukaryotic-like serine/threonine-protein kinase
MSESEIASGRIIAGKYRLEAAIARGGMGSVWRARHLTLDAPLAVKFIGANVSRMQEARKRFEREAKAAALLQSPHVVQIYDYGVEGEVPYLVMELLDGEDLGDRLKKSRLSLAETSSIVTQIARALRRAAEAGIVHRDLKPGNVFLVRGEEEELVKVLDFGIAKVPRLRGDDDRTKTGTVLGSPRYMSPEQARGNRLVDARSDLWSLAVIAYRAITGRLPFQSTDIADLIVKICSEDAEPPSSIDPAFGPEVDAFFARGFARDPEERFQTARELAVSFAIAAGQPPSSLSFQARSNPELPLPVLPARRESASALPTPLLVVPAPAPAAVSLPDCNPTLMSERTSRMSPKPRRPFADSTTAPEPRTPSQIPPLPGGDPGSVRCMRTAQLSTQPDCTLTAYPRSSGAPSRALAPRTWRTALVAAAAVFLGGGLVLVPWSLMRGSARVVTAAADVQEVAPPPQPAPPPRTTSEAAPPAAAPSAVPQAPAPAPAPPRQRRAPELRPPRTKRHAILGI